MWLWIRAQRDNLWPPDNEDIAEQLGNDWDKVADALVATIALANQAVSQVMTAWPDVAGQTFTRKLSAVANGTAGAGPGGGMGSAGHEELVAMMREMARTAHKYAETIQHIKLTIKVEIAINIALFALSFLLPPGIGDLFRWRMAATIATRLANLVRIAAGAMGHAAAGLRPALAHLAKEIVMEGFEEAVIEGTAQFIGKNFGYRDEYDPKQILINTGAGGGGAILALPLGPLGRGASRITGGLARALPSPTRIAPIKAALVEHVEQGTHVFVVNGITSPIAGTTAQAIADGKLKELSIAGYGQAILDQGLGAGALGAMRAHSTLGGTQLGHAWSSAAGIAPPVAGHATANPAIDPGPNPPVHTPAQAGATSAAPGSTTPGQGAAGNQGSLQSGTSSHSGSSGADASGGSGSDQGSATGRGTAADHNARAAQSAHDQQNNTDPTQHAHSGEHQADIAENPTDQTVESQAPGGDPTNQVGAEQHLGGDHTDHLTTDSAQPDTSAHHAPTNSTDTSATDSSNSTNSSATDSSTSTDGAATVAPVAAQVHAQPAATQVHAQPASGATASHSGSAANASPSSSTQQGVPVAPAPVDKAKDSQQSGSEQHDDASVSQETTDQQTSEVSPAPVDQSVQEDGHTRDPATPVIPAPGSSFALAAAAVRAADSNTTDSSSAPANGPAHTSSSNDSGKPPAQTGPQGPVGPVDPPGTAEESAEPGEFGWFDQNSPVIAPADQKPRGPINDTGTKSSGKNTARWFSDENGWLRSVHAHLAEDHGGGGRTAADAKAQAEAAGRGTAGDQGGHALAWRFFRETVLQNLFPQAAQLNNSAFRKLENEWVAWIKSGHEIDLVVRVPPGQKRPDSVTVTYTVTDSTGRVIWAGGRTFINQNGQIYTRYPTPRIKVFAPNTDNLFEPPTTPPPSPPTGPPPSVPTTPTPPSGPTTPTPPSGPTTPTPPGGSTTPTPPSGAATSTPPSTAPASTTPATPPTTTPAGDRSSGPTTSNPPSPGSSDPTTQAGPTGTADSDRGAIRRALNPENGPVDPSEGGHRGDTVHSPEVPHTRYVADGRPVGAPVLTPADVVAAIAGLQTSDFGGAISGVQPISPVDFRVDIPGADSQYFHVEIGPVRRGSLAATTIGAGTDVDPHQLTVAPGVHNAILARVGVHEISHTMQELNSPPQGVIRRLWGRLTGAEHNACVDAQFNEHRLLTRQWAEAVEQARRTGLPADQQAELDLRNDIEGLAKAIEARGRVAPAHPWESSTTPPTLAEYKAEVARRRQALDDVLTALHDRIRAKTEAAAEAGRAREKAERDLTKAMNAKDNGRFARTREAGKEIQKNTEVETRHRALAAKYQTALSHVEAAATGYDQILADTAATAPDQLADATRAAAADLAAYEQLMATVAPAPAALASLVPTGTLPHLTRLTEQLNAELVARGIDHEFTATSLQQLLSAEFRNVAGPEGAVLRVGRARVAEVRVRLNLSELAEVTNPGMKFSEMVFGLFPQGGRRLATTQTSTTSSSNRLSLTALIRLLSSVPGLQWVGEHLTLKLTVSSDQKRSVTTNAAAYAQSAGVENNRGEALLLSGKAGWQLDIRRQGTTTWLAAGEVATGNQGDSKELRAWISHTYVDDPSVRLVQRADLDPAAKQVLPPHVPSAISGLHALNDDVQATFAEEIRKLGAGAARQVREQLQAALTEDLPGRLSESTEHAVLRPLMVAGKPVGHVQVETTVRYEEAELVGGQSTAHWQERNRIDSGTASARQNFGAGVSVSTATGLGGEGFTDVDGSEINWGPGATGGHSASRSEGLSAGGTALQIHGQRFTGPTQGYRLVFDHKVTLVLGTRTVGTAEGNSAGLVRLQANDAYRAGLPVDESVLVRAADGTPLIENGQPVLRGDIRTDVDLAGRKLELPAWARDALGRLRGSGPWAVQAVTGGKQAFESIVAHLSERGFLPDLDAAGNPDLSRLSSDPLERHSQLLNLAELQAQLSADRLEAGYDTAAQGGLVVTLSRSDSAGPTETVSLRIAIEQGTAKAVGVTSDESMVTLVIGSDSAGRSGEVSRALPWTASPIGVSSDGGPAQTVDTKADVSYGRRSLGRVLNWFTGGTVNRVTLVESTSPLAVFEISHRLVVTELTAGGPELVHAGVDGTSARVLLDSDLLPYSAPTATVVDQNRPVAQKVLDRAVVLALGAQDLIRGLPEALTSDATALQHLAAFLSPRNLIAHPEWTQDGYRTAAVVRGWGPASKRSTVSLSGTVQGAELVSVTEGVSGDIVLALSNNGVSAGSSGNSTARFSAGAAEDSSGGGINGSLGTGTTRTQQEQSVWGTERQIIEVGRQYVFKAGVMFDLAVDKLAPAQSRSETVFQLSEIDALRFYGQAELSLPLDQVADAVERYLQGDLELSRPDAARLVRTYRAELAAARASGTPVPALAADHTINALAGKLVGRPLPSTGEARLTQALALAEKLAEPTRLPGHFQRNLGASLIEGIELTDGQHSEIRLVEQVKAQLREQLGIDAEQDPVLAEALFAELAGKRWWGRMDDMLGPDGFARTYPVGKPGALKGQRVAVRIRAMLTEDAVSLGETGKTTISTVQRYVYDEQSRTVANRRSAGMGADGSIDAGHGGSLSTDRSGDGSVAHAEQRVRIERVATFDGLTRMQRGVRLSIEVVHEPVAGGPTRGRLARTAIPGPPAIAPAPVELKGSMVQLVPRYWTNAANPGPVQPGEVVLPSTYFVEGTVGSAEVENSLLAAINEQLARPDILSLDGIRSLRDRLTSVLSAAVRAASFSRAASPDSQVMRFAVPDTVRQVVDVGVRARVTGVQLLSGPTDGVEIGEVNRSMATVSHTTTSSRLLPVTSGGTLDGAVLGGGMTSGEQLTDTVTDVRGARGELSRYEKGSVVTVKVSVEYDVKVARSKLQRSGGERVLVTRATPAVATGEAYLTMSTADYRAMIEGLVPAVPTSPSPSAPAPARSPALARSPVLYFPGSVHTASSYLLALRRAQQELERNSGGG
ncbi:DNA/RNA non-specific endonuclease [Kribbella sp. NPDC051620]|uniref:WXG100-like domain-containing protein n=1 Tax=Kribbella sp. NPDC051620 TaxID=3364120 RepID=UPI0037B9214B